MSVNLPFLCPVFTLFGARSEGHFGVRRFRTNIQGTPESKIHFVFSCVPLEISTHNHRFHAFRCRLIKLPRKPPCFEASLWLRAAVRFWPKGQNLRIQTRCYTSRSRCRSRCRASRSRCRSRCRASQTRSRTRCINGAKHGSGHGASTEPDTEHC